MKIQMLQDFRGRETNEAYYRKGDIINLDDQMALNLILEGRAKAVKHATNKHAGDVQHGRRGNSDK